MDIMSLAMSKKILGGGSSGGGGASSWNDLTDKPFGEESVEPIVWDGNTADKTLYVLTRWYNYYKVSDFPSTPAEFVGSIVSTPESDLTLTIEDNFEEITAYNDTTAYVSDPFLVLPTAIEFEDGIVASPGLYIREDHGDLPLAISLPEKVKKLDEKYLPDRLYGEVTETIEPITWDGNTEGLVEVDIFGNKFYKVSDKAFSNEQIKEMSASVYEEWVESEDSDSGVFPVDFSEEWADLTQDGLITEDYFAHPAGILVVRKNDAVLPDGTALPEIGTYFLMGEQNDEDYYSLWYTNSFPSETTTVITAIKKVDKKYLPDPDVFTVILTERPDENSQGWEVVTPNKTFEEVLDAINNDRYIDIKYRYIYGECVRYYPVAFYEFISPINTGAPVPFIELESVGDNGSGYWTAEGISSTDPTGGK